MPSPIQNLRFNQQTLSRFLDEHEKASQGAAFAQRRSFMSCDFSGLSFAGRDLSNFSAIGCSFVNADLSRTSLRFANLYGADLRGASLKQADFTRADLRGACLRSADLGGANLQEAAMERGKLLFAQADGGFRDSAVQVRMTLEPDVRALTSSDIRDTDMRGAILENADLGESDLSYTDLTGANLRDANLQRTNLSGARLFGADLRGARFNGAKLRQTNFVTAIYDQSQFESCDTSATVFPRRIADLSDRLPALLAAHKEWVDTLGRSGTRADFTMVDLRGYSFEKHELSAAVFTLAIVDSVSFRESRLAMADFSGASGRSAVFCDADMRGVTLTRAVFNGADFRGANLSCLEVFREQPVHLRARLHQTSLIGANLSRSNLVSADLELADLTEANLSHADLEDSVFVNTYCYGASMRGAKTRGALLDSARGLEHAYR